MSSPRPHLDHTAHDDVIIEENTKAEAVKVETVKAEKIKSEQILDEQARNDDAHQPLLEESVQDAQNRYKKAREELKDCFFENKHNKTYNTRLIMQARCIKDLTDKEYDKTEVTDRVKFSALADALECCVEGIKNPLSHDNFNRVSNLAANSETQASLGKKIAGGLLLFVGILSVLAFGALVLATHGVALAALPVIGPAVTTGLAWMGAAATALGVSAEILTFAGLGVGATATIGGTALAISGQSRGLARSMYSFHNELNNIRKKDEAAKHDFMNEPERASLLVQ